MFVPIWLIIAVAVLLGILGGTVMGLLERL